MKNLRKHHCFQYLLKEILLLLKD